MNPQLLIYPMFAMVVLTAIVLISLFRARVRAVSTGAVSATYFRTYQDGSEPVETAKISRHFTNLFEAPVLFYVCSLAAMVVNEASLLLVALAWLYVLARAVHAYIHTGSNRLRQRIGAYFASWIVLFAMWVVLVASVATAG
jgi:hypothetical protein